MGLGADVTGPPPPASRGKKLAERMRAELRHAEESGFPVCLPRPGLWAAFYRGGGGGGGGLPVTSGSQLITHSRWREPDHSTEDSTQCPMCKYTDCSSAWLSSHPLYSILLIYFLLSFPKNLLCVTCLVLTFILDP